MNEVSLGTLVYFFATILEEDNLDIVQRNLELEFERIIEIL